MEPNQEIISHSFDPPIHEDSESLRSVVEKISDQLCFAVNGQFDFTIRAQTQDESAQKLSMLINFVIDAARRSLMEVKKTNHNLEQEIEERKKLELKNEKLNNDLVSAARQAGMADIATSVLHNVGNVLNSVNTSVSLLAEKIVSSKMENLAKLADLLEQHKTDIGNFISSDAQGAQIPLFLTKLAESWKKEKNYFLEEIKSLEKNVTHIKEIISKQNSLHTTIEVVESVYISDLLEDALALNRMMLNRTNIVIERKFNLDKPVMIDRVKLLQVLVNMIKNSTESLMECQQEINSIIIFLQEKDPTHFVIRIVDNGIGVSKENVTRIFSHGFTTKKEGHGFGLHASANAVKEMGGNLTLNSEGEGKGAEIVIELPLKLSQ